MFRSALDTGAERLRGRAVPFVLKDQIMIKPRFFFVPILTVILATGGVRPSVVYAHGPETQKPAASQSATQAWQQLQTAFKSVQTLTAAKDLKGLHDLTEQMEAAFGSLKGAGGKDSTRLDAAVKQGIAISGAIHVAADTGDQAKTESEVKKLGGVMKLVEANLPAEVKQAPAAAASAPAIPASPAMAGMEGHDDHQKSAATNSVKATAKTAKPLVVGERANVVLSLAKQDGTALGPDDLLEAHTKKVHLLIIDESLTDYTHEHPNPTSVPGEYAFSFTPRKPGSYRIWADLVPKVTNEQEYVVADLPSATKGLPISDRKPSLVSKVDGLTYTITFDKPVPKAGDAVLGKLTITDASGKQFDQLEPVMGAYAHIVGFAEDRKGIAHIHPMGAEPTKPTDRGAGELEFHLQPEKAGLMRLFAQVQIGGVDKFAPFTLTVEP